jgi:methionyl-tRNA formyltransferase
VLAADDQLVMACGDGALSFSELQLEGKRRMAAGELLRGFKIAPGARAVRL